MSLTIAEYLCPNCDRFELLIERPPPDRVTCPDCDAISEWTISAPLVRVKLASAATQGSYVKPEHPLALDTRELGEGMPINEWRKKRAKKWREHDINSPKRRALAEATDKVLNKAEGVVRDRPDQKKKRMARLFNWLGGKS